MGAAVGGAGGANESGVHADATVTWMVGTMADGMSMGDEAYDVARVVEWLPDRMVTVPSGAVVRVDAISPRLRWWSPGMHSCWTR